MLANFGSQRVAVVEAINGNNPDGFPTLLTLIDYIQTVTGLITCSATRISWMNIAF